MMMIYLATTFCLMITISIEAAQSRGDLCDDMMRSVNSLCPSHEKVVYCPDAEQLQKRLDDAVILNWNLMSALAAAETKLAKLENTETTTTATEKSKCQALDGLFYLERCYTVALPTVGKYMGFDEAVERCNETGGILGEVYSVDHETALQTFIRHLIPSSKNFLYVWIGMKYQQSTSTLLYRNGEEKATTDFRWDALYPRTASPYMALEVGSDGDYAVGFWNAGPDHDVDAVLCEKTL